MIVLDTNVLSAVISAVRFPAVLEWLNGQDPDEIRITAITVYETKLGIERLPEGKKRRDLERSFAYALTDYLSERVLAFDTIAAQQAGIFHAARLRAGRPIDFRDAQIAGTASVHGARLATRNVDDFAGLGLVLLNPWSA